ncbi:Lipoprotein [Pseudomonas zeae]
MYTNPCRSEPARDSGGSANLYVKCATAIASRLTPTVTAVLRLVMVGVMLLLSACASQAPLPAGNPTLPLPLQLHIERQQAEQRQDWLLVIQREGPGIRWSMMDPLGIPQARQQLIDGHWQADGLLPPNPEARELFAALLFALTPSGELLRNYPAALQQGQQRALPARWDIRYSQPLSFELNLPQGPHYRVSPLGEPTP